MKIRIPSVGIKAKNRIWKRVKNSYFYFVALEPKISNQIKKLILFKSLVSKS